MKALHEIALTQTIALLQPVFIDAAIKGFVFLGVAATIAILCKRTSAAIRHLIWTTAIFGILFLPVLSATLPSWNIHLAEWKSIPSVTSVTASQPELGIQRSVSATLSNPQEHLRSVGELSAGQTLETAAAVLKRDSHSTNLADSNGISNRERSAVISAGFTLLQWVFILWGAASLVTVLPVIIGYLQIRRLTASCQVITCRITLTLFDSLFSELSFRRKVEIRKGSAIRMPSTWGVFRPVILLPDEAVCWNEKRLRVVLLHELAHIKRHDWLTQIVASAACAVYWFNPLTWIAAGRMRVEREKACDDRVLSAGVRPTDYADELLHIASKHTNAGLVGSCAVPMARWSSLEDRLVSILDADLKRSGVTRFKIGAVLVAAAVIISPIAMIRTAEAAPKLSGGYEDEVIRSKNDFSVKAGRLRFLMKGIARRDSQQAPVFENGKGQGVAPFDLPPISDSSRDESQLIIDLGRDKGYDIVEIRIFDHATRSLLFDNAWKSGVAPYAAYRYGGSSKLVLSSFKNNWPGKLDIWLRLVEADTHSPSLTVKAVPGQVGRVGRAEIEVREIYPGHRNYTQDQKTGTYIFNETPREDADKTNKTTVLFALKAGMINGRYFVTAIDHNGHRFAPDYPHFHQFTSEGESRVAVFDLPPERIDRFEWLSFASRPKFFFDGVQVPRRNITPQIIESSKGASQAAFGGSQAPDEIGRTDVVEFSEIKEILLPMIDKQKRFFSLSTGELLKSGADDEPMLFAEENNEEVILSFRNIYTYELGKDKGLKVWETLSAEEFYRNYRESGFAMLPFERNLTSVLSHEKLPATYTLPPAGILQATEIVRGTVPLLRIRYKLLRQAKPEKPEYLGTVTDMIHVQGTNTGNLLQLNEVLQRLSNREAKLRNKVIVCDYERKVNDREKSPQRIERIKLTVMNENFREERVGTGSLAARIKNGNQRIELDGSTIRYFSLDTGHAIESTLLQFLWGPPQWLKDQWLEAHKSGNLRIQHKRIDGIDCIEIATSDGHTVALAPDFDWAPISSLKTKALEIRKQADLWMPQKVEFSSITKNLQGEFHHFTDTIQIQHVEIIEGQSGNTMERPFNLFAIPSPSVTNRVSVAYPYWNPEWEKGPVPWRLVRDAVRSERSFSWNSKMSEAEQLVWTVSRGWTDRALVEKALQTAENRNPIALPFLSSDGKKVIWAAYVKNEQRLRTVNAPAESAHDVNSPSAKSSGVQVNPSTTSPRDVVNQWLKLLKAKNTKEIWDLTTRESGGAGSVDLQNTWELVKIKALHLLGNETAAMVITNPYRDNAGRQRVLQFLLVRQNGKWLIRQYYEDGPEGVRRRAEGFASYPGVKYEVSTEELVGEWVGLGFIPTEMHLYPDGTGSFIEMKGPESGKPNSFQWSIEGNRFRRIWENQEISGELVLIERDSFVVRHSVNAQSGYHRKDPEVLDD